MKQYSLEQFAKGQRARTNAAKTAVAYTRVSTKEQADNNQSLFTQLKYIKQYAEKNNLNIISEFGGTYESAKSDERKEFKRMLIFAKKRKVDLILVYSIDRFSRSGPNAVYISEQLRKSGIRIMSVTQPIDSLTASGELQQNIYFMFSQYENQQRREKSMAGTKEKLLQGEWVTRPPFGYDIVRINGKREIVVNQDGKLLQKAFRLRIRRNYSFKELSQWMSHRGVKIHHKRLSDLSRNIFYCGMMAHAALEGEVVRGNHEALLTKKEFLLLNEMMQERAPKNAVNSQALPLRNHLVCSDCGGHLTGYLVKKKNLYYYKCNTVGCKLNVSAKKIHHKWENLLEDLQLDSKLIPAIRVSLERKLEKLEKVNMEDIKPLKKRLTQINNKIEAIEERFAVGEISLDIYEKYRKKFESERAPIIHELQKSETQVSNHSKTTQKALENLSNLLILWNKLDSKSRKDLAIALFPEGIILDKENRDYRTFNMNPFVRCVEGIATDLTQTEKRKKEEYFTYSALVARPRIELGSKV